MGTTFILSVLIGALLLGMLLLLLRLLQERRRAAQSERDSRRDIELLTQELDALKLTLEQRTAAQEQRTAAQEQRTAAHALESEQAKRDFDAFAYAVSHDLAAPGLLRRLSQAGIGITTQLGQETVMSLRRGECRGPFWALVLPALGVSPGLLALSLAAGAVVAPELVRHDVAD